MASIGDIIKGVRETARKAAEAGAVVEPTPETDPWYFLSLDEKEPGERLRAYYEKLARQEARRRRAAQSRPNRQPPRAQGPVASPEGPRGGMVTILRTGGDLGHIPRRRISGPPRP
jgi:hypothetical protein